MSTAKHRDLSKERFWRTQVRRWQRSGLSVRAFCAEHRMSEPSFHNWRRTLARRDAEAVQFVPVEVVAEPMRSGAADSPTSGLELLLNAGRVLRIGPNFDGPTLRRLLAVLEEGRP